MPFVTEEIWNVLGLGDGSILESTPEPGEAFPRDEEAETTMASLMGVVDSVRNIRGEVGVHPSQEVPLYLRFSRDSGIRDAILGAGSYIMKLAGVRTVVEGPPPKAEGPVATGVVGQTEIWVPLGDVIDVEVEKTRLTKEINRIEHLLEKSTARVENPDFNLKAPPDVVAREKEKIEQLTENMAKLKKNLSVLLSS